MAKTVSAVIKLIDQFSNPSKKIVEQSKNIEKRMQNTAKKVGKFGKQITQYGETMTKYFTGPVAAVATASVSFASETESATSKFLNQTGIMGDAVEDGVKNSEKYRDMIESIYKGNYYDSIEEVADALGKVKQNMSNLDDSSLKRVTEYADALSDTFDVGVSESTRSASTLMKNFEVSAEEAFNLMVQGAQKGLDFSGELYDNIDEYSVQFKKLGLGAEDMFNIFAAGAESGAFNLDKIGDAVKELSIRVIDGSDTTKAGFEALGLDADNMASKFASGGDSAREAFQKVISGLESMDDPVQRNIAGVNLFGTMWEDLGEEVVLSLGNMDGSINKTNDAMEKLMSEKDSGLKETIAEFGRTLQVDVLGPIGEDLVPYVEMAIEKLHVLSNWWKNLSDDQKDAAIKIAGFVAAAGPLLMLGGKIIQSFVGPIKMFGKFYGEIKKFKLVAKEAGGVGKLFSGRFSKIGGVLKTIGAGFMAIPGPVKIVIAVLAALVAVGVLVYKNWDKIKEIFGKVAEKAGEFRDTVVSKVTEVGNKLLEFKDNAVAKFRDGFSNAVSKIKENFPGLTSSIEQMFEGVKKVFSGIVDFVKGVFTNNWKSAWEGVVSVFSGIWDVIGGYVKAPLNGMIDLVNKAISNINKLSVSIPSWVPGVGGNTIGFNIPKIPNLYTGTDNWSGGLAAINEPKYGGEIVDLPSGTRVYPHDESLDIARSEGSRVININIKSLAENISVRSDQDIERIVDLLAKKIEETALNIA